MNFLQPRLLARPLASSVPSVRSRAAYAKSAESTTEHKSAEPQRPRSGDEEGVSVRPASSPSVIKLYIPSSDPKKLTLSCFVLGLGIRLRRSLTRMLRTSPRPVLSKPLARSKARYAPFLSLTLAFSDAMTDSVLHLGCYRREGPCSLLRLPRRRPTLRATPKNPRSRTPSRRIA